jgi:imidazole glycerol-phosphate synthase subunit HisH
MGCWPHDLAIQMKHKTIFILNLGMGNIASIKNMFKKVGVSAKEIATAGEVNEAQALVIPGVGKFDHAMSQIESMGLRGSLEDAALSRKIPILGICLGMQLMTRGSEEGQLPGLRWIKASTRLISDASQDLRVPHMGWNLLSIKKNSPYFDDIFAEQRFYFVHSYAVHCDDPADVLTTTHYAGEFVSAFSAGNLLGVQFHPEKSHRFGASFFHHYAVAHGLIGF